ncbi:NAD(P)-binding protein [Atractiella rhizophila]|nr:NAD(P)-binding protein [Atractiella rhizophila]
MTGRNSLVTGTSGGLGLELVHQLSNNPSDLVFALTRNPSAATSLLALANERKNVIVVKGDMTEEASMKAAFEEVKERVGGKGIDVLIAKYAFFFFLTRTQKKSNYSAGAIDVGGIKRGVEEMRREKFSNVPLQDFSELFNINVIGTLRTVNTFLSLVKGGKEKKIVIVSSTIGSCSYVNVDAIFDPLNNGVFAPYADFSDETRALKAPLEAPEAIEMLIKLVDKITLSDSGRFIDVPEDTDAAF